MSLQRGLLGDASIGNHGQSVGRITLMGIKGSFDGGKGFFFVPVPPVADMTVGSEEHDFGGGQQVGLELEQILAHALVVVIERMRRHQALPFMAREGLDRVQQLPVKSGLELHLIGMQGGWELLFLLSWGLAQYCFSCSVFSTCSSIALCGWAGSELSR
jgi:hypothetical protein